MALSCSEPWLTTPQMAGRLGVHPKTLLRLRAACFSPFREGEHYRRGGLTTKAPFQWHGDRSEEVFTSFGRVDPTDVEAFSNEDLLISPECFPHSNASCSNGITTAQPSILRRGAA
jgi:hypothetical protein